MTSRWRSALALKAPNVVCLPTAAPRQVRQPCNKAGRAARQKLREAQPWPGEYILPSRRAALRTAEKVVDAGSSATGLTIALALADMLDDELRVRLIGKIAASGSPAASAAIAMIDCQRITVGERIDLEWALERLRSRGGKT